MNCYSPALDDYWARDMLRDHIQTSGRVEYALFDFNLSVQFPADLDIRTARLPSREAWCGALMFHPTDATMGQPEYNPFPFDVACLGNLLLYHFSVRLVATIEPLAADDGLERCARRTPPRTLIRTNDDARHWPAVHSVRSARFLRRALRTSLRGSFEDQHSGQTQLRPAERPRLVLEAARDRGPGAMESVPRTSSALESPIPTLAFHLAVRMGDLLHSTIYSTRITFSPLRIGLSACFVFI